MRCLIDGRWRNWELDSNQAPGTHRVQVLALRNLEKIEDLYFVRRASLRTVWNYLRDIGPAGVLRKIASRRGEKFRNDKYVSCGLGRIAGAGPDGWWSERQLVVFIATSAPACADQLVVTPELVMPIEEIGLPDFDADELRYVALTESNAVASWWSSIAGWHPDSGQMLSPFVTESALKEAEKLLRETDWSGAEPLPVDAGRRASEIGRFKPVKARTAGGDRPSAVLFGYGNYAKTVVLPNVSKQLDLECVHEIDPLQVPEDGAGIARWDTSPRHRDDEAYDVALIAGYHHSHAPLACEALRRGSAVVVEKPVATTREQLEELVATMRETGGRVFTCLQRRYTELNELARQDLQVEPGDPISYHAIAYEVPLPERHWYRWKNSGSRLLSNGVHWIDHFLFLNDYAPVRHMDLNVASDGTINCSIELENKAFFTLVLTDQGSERIGVQDHVELRAHGVTVKLVNAVDYVAESADRVLRRKRIRKLGNYAAMYQEIARRIVEGHEGDGIRCIERSAGLVLDLEERLEELLLAREVYEASHRVRRGIPQLRRPRPELGTPDLHEPLAPPALA